MPDGSIVELNRGAALKVDYTPEMRRVELVSSEAHFDVAKYPDRPFIVSAGGVDFRAVGMAFNVKLTGDSVELLIARRGTMMRFPVTLGEKPKESWKLQVHPDISTDARARLIGWLGEAGASLREEESESPTEDTEAGTEPESSSSNPEGSGR